MYIISVRCKDSEYRRLRPPRHSSQLLQCLRTERGRERPSKPAQHFLHPCEQFCAKHYVIPSSTHVDLKSMHVDPINYVRRSMDYAHRSRTSTTTPWLLLWEKASLSRLGHSFSSARQSLMLRISIFVCKLFVVCPYVKGPPDSSSIENTYL